MTAAAVPFAEFFAAVWGRPPFAWQERLAGQVAAEGWPETIDLPTGVGKTAAIDVAVWHLATAARSHAARRILFVVDRRVVVDAAFARAEAIAAALRDAPAGSPLEPISTRLRQMTGIRSAEPLRVARLRGGVPREPDWAGLPTQPLVAVSTVDQVGSRLLFRGYGVSPSMLPVQAGLMGEDALILLDEAHLSEPFRQTLAGLRGLRDDATSTLPAAPWQHVVLSATPGEGSSRTFRLRREDWSSEPLRPRLHATKAARLVSAKRGDDPFEAAVAEAAIALSAADAGAAQAMLVVVNRVATARAVHGRITSTLGERADVELVIGRSRPLDRERRAADWLPRIAAGRDDDGTPRQVGVRPLIIVATQCVEAGADLDADALVTESAPLDALRQRFGRLDRLGRLQRDAAPRAVIVHRGSSTPDPIYGEALRRTWDWLQQRAGDEGSGPVVDFGLVAMHRTLNGTPADEMAPLLTPRLNAPVLVPGHLDAWTETSPPGLSPEPSLFLHGPHAVADVTIVWRRDITSAQLAELGEGPHDVTSLELVPPSALEAVSVSPWSARAWLAGDQRSISVPLADIEGGVEPTDDAAVESASVARLALRRRGDEGWEVIGATDVRPGDLLVLPADAGGCDAFGWNPASTVPVTDLGDEAHRRQRGQWVLRLPAAPGSVLSEQLLSHQDDPVELLGRLADSGDLPTDAPPPATLQLHWYEPGDPGRGLILVESRRGRRGADATTEDDSGSLDSAPVTIAQHHRDVAEWVVRLAGQLALSDVERRALQLAAEFHDAGKADRRFQAMLRGVSRISRFDDRPPIAKGAVPWQPGARARAGIPAGWRHEVGSVAVAATSLAGESDELRDLTLWLIGTHHGRGRPFYDDVPDPEGEVSPSDVISGHLERADRLRARYGPYRLAWLEGILRLADHRASAAGAPEAS